VKKRLGGPRAEVGRGALDLEEIAWWFGDHAEPA
jgi:hypothetical protein